MPLPRPQVSLRSVLVGVAFVALNCAVYRYLCEVDWASEDAGYFAIGSLPLFNFALVGIVSFVAKRARSRWSGREANLPACPAGFTFFSLHFLALGHIASSFGPRAMKSQLEFLRPVAEFVSKAWSAAVEPYGRAVPDAILEGVFLGVVISGPLLVLSWIGSAFAKRCAATLPLRRFRVLACLVSLGFASVALAVAVTPQPFTDEQNIDLDFQIVDQESGQQIHAALLQISDAFSYTTPERVLTDADGARG